MMAADKAGDDGLAVTLDDLISLDSVGCVLSDLEYLVILDDHIHTVENLNRFHGLDDSCVSDNSGHCHSSTLVSR